MENKETQETSQAENVETPISKEIGDFNFLICTVIEYYQAKSGEPLDPDEKWKEGTEHAPKPPIDIPDRVDALVEKAFMKQLKNFA